MTLRCVRLLLDALEAREVPAVAGSIDSSFANGGRAQVAFNLGGNNLDRALAVAAQADGATVLAGSIAVTGGSNFGVVRLTPTGALDATFGGSGKAVISFAATESAGTSRAAAVAVQPDGRIVVAGTTSGNGDDFAVVRLNADGTLDTTFGSGGKVVFGFNRGGRNDDILAGIALQPDGNIVLAGTVEAANGTDFGLVRLTSAGIVDDTFGTLGTATVGMDLGRTNDDKVGAVALTPDNRILVVGSADTPVGFDFAIARFTSAGLPDMSLDADGKRAFGFDLGGSADDFANAVVVKSNLQFVVAGQAVALGRSEFAAVQFNADGSVDTAFGTQGKTTVNMNAGAANQSAANAVLIQPGASNVPGTERLVLVGSVDPGTNAEFALVGLTTNGGLDATFGIGGKTTVAFNQGGRNNDYAYGATVVPSGRIVVVGSAETGGTNNLGDIAAVRLFGNPPEPQPLLAGGIANGTARVLALGSRSGSAVNNFSYVPSETLNIFPGFTGTVRTATGDLNNDGVADLIGGAGPGGSPRIAVLDGKTGSRIVDFFAFESVFSGGVFVSAADVTGDGRVDVIVTPDEGGGPVTVIYDGARLARGLTGEAAQVIRFFGIDDKNFRGGARSTAGDITGDGIADVVVAAGFGGGPRITIWDGSTVRAGTPASIKNFFAFEPELRNGAFVSAGDVNGDGTAELVFGGGPGGGPRIRIFDGKMLNAASFDRLDQIPTAQLANFFAGPTTSRGGVHPALADRNADGKTELIVGSGAGDTPLVSVYSAADLLAIATPTPSDQFDPFFVAVPGGVFVG